MWGTVSSSCCACHPGRCLHMAPLVMNLWACHIICRQSEVPPTRGTSFLTFIFQYRGFTKVCTIKSKILKACHMEKHLLLLAVYVLVCKLFWEGTHFMCRVLYRALILRADALETRGNLFITLQPIFRNDIPSHLHSSKWACLDFVSYSLSLCI